MGSYSDTPVDNLAKSENAPSSAGEREMAKQLDILSRELPEQYEIIERVTEGGMGAIFKARNRHTGSVYAVKILHPDCDDNEEMHKRFFLEAKVASTLKHPNICQFQDFGVTESGTAYLVMEWISGINLCRKVMRDGPLPVEEALQIYIQIAAALEYAHENKLIHRDLKPENIMLSRRARDGQTQVHIVDFGIAKLAGDEQSISRSKGLTQTGMIVGTPLYMSPEQARALDVDQRSDIYSFGCLMYFGLSGEPPFEGDSILDTMYAHVSKEVAPFDAKLKIPEDLSMIVYKAMEKEPSDRYQNAHALGADLRKVHRGITVETKPLARERVNKRNNLMKGASFAVGLVLMYLLSIGLQSLFATIAKTARDNTQKIENATPKPASVPARKPSAEQTNAKPVGHKSKIHNK